MIDELKICHKPHPLGYRCGLYAWHRKDRTPHRILRRDYPHSQTVKRSPVIEWWDYSFSTPEEAK